MPKKEQGLAHTIAMVAAVLLWTFITFCGGLIVSQTDTFEKIAQSYKSGKAQAEKLPYAKDAFDKELTVWKDKPHALQGGALLIGSQYSQNPALMLVDEDGNILHRWNVQMKLFNYDILRWWTEPFETKIFAIDDAHLLPNGDVIFIQDMRELQNFRGQRLARMDADSHVLWQVPGAFHHEIDIAGTPQRIYAMASVLRDELPVIGAKLDNIRYLEDMIYEFDLNGKKLNEWSVYDAFAHSPYRNWLTSFEIDIPELQRINSPDSTQRTLYDLIHLNSVQYLDAKRAKAITTAQEGDLLISMRGTNTIALLRPSAKKIVWAARGPWRHQHYVKVEDDGKLYVYDNEGSTAITQTPKGAAIERLQSRIIRFDPATAMWDDVYSSSKIHSYWRGYYYFLPGGDIIASSAEQSRVVVVSPEKKIVWELRGVPNREIEVIPYLKQISTVRYYPPEALTFLTAQGNKPLSPH